MLLPLSQSSRTPRPLKVEQLEQRLHLLLLIKAASGITPSIKDTNSATNTPSASINGAASSSEGGDREKTINVTHDSVTNLDPLGAAAESESRSTTLVNSIPGSPSFGTASTATLSKVEDITLATTAPSESVWDSHTQANGHEKPTEPGEGRRGKKGKKQKNAEKEAEKEAEKQKEEEKKLEMLVAAPPPAVNIWQQRAQALQVKPSSSATQTQGSTETSKVGESATKPIESKRKGKSNAVEDGEKVSSPSQPGTGKDSTNHTKGQNKGAEAVNKGREDSSFKRAGPRGGRAAENEKPVASQLPPPVEDAMSWPTPETALEEEKRKALEKEKSENQRSEKEKEKEERDETVSHKPRPKQKYVAVPFVPSVNFNTPMPSNRGPSNRGGRGRGGARGGRDSNGGRSDVNGGTNGERVNNGSTASPPGDSETRGRGGSTTTRDTSLPPNSNKQSSGDTRTQGKTSTALNPEKAKASQNNAPKNESSTSTEPQNNSTLLQVDLSEAQQSGRGEIFRGGKSENTQGSLNETSSGSGTADRRSEASSKGFEQFKDGANFGKDPGQTRDRADGRIDRGRGGFRGRGGHNNFANGLPQSQPIYTNGHVSQPPNGYPVRQNSNPYSPPMQQPPFSSQYSQAPPPVRGGRVGSRNQSIPNSNAYGRFPHNGNMQLAPSQTPGSMYDYPQPPLQTVGAGPYPGSYPEQEPNVMQLVGMQLEYYFSIDNLCKDVYLRKHMDSQGFVFLQFIAGFKRIQGLTQEIEQVRVACQASQTIDLIRGEDGVDRVRRRDGWEQWVLDMEERDPSVRNAGPTQHHHHHQDPRVFQQVQPIGAYQGYPPAIQSPMFSPNGTEARFPMHYPNGTSIARLPNGNGSNHHTDTQLSASVPDFAPSKPYSSGTEERLIADTTFGDDQVSNLKLVFAPPKGNDVPRAGPPYHSASSRTFSNGSIDGRSIAEEIHDPRQRLANGSRTSEM